VNLFLVQCECHTGKLTVIARIKSINQYYATDFQFSRNFWFLIPISRGENARFAPLRTPMPQIVQAMLNRNFASFDLSHEP